MTDFPLLCKVLEDYDSTKHHARIKRYDSGDLELSSKTTVSFLSSDSPDCEVLEHLIESLQVEAGEFTSKETSPEQTPSPTKPTHVEGNGRVLDRFGYRMIDISALTQKKDELRRCQSADDIFDDPEYSATTAPHTIRLGSIPEYPVTPRTSQPTTEPTTASVTATNENSMSIPRSLSATDVNAFEKRHYKMYMSLQQVMEILDTKISTDDHQKATSNEVEGNDLYGPRLVLPPIHHVQ